MGLLSKLFKGSAGELVEKVGGVVERVSAGHLGKKELALEVEKLIAARDESLESTLRTELAAKERVLVAELQQGDNFTKRARPAVVYTGLAYIGINYVVSPLVAAIGGYEMATMELPTQFWAAWGGIVATWCIGRSFEKAGVKNKVVQGITGSRLLD